jgi:hypothetical protein
MSGMRVLMNSWFTADFLVALLPPLYWAFGGAKPAVLGAPESVAYFLFVAAFICASIVVAYLVERRDGSLD